MKRAFSAILIVSLAILVLAWVGCEESNDPVIGTGGPGASGGTSGDSGDPAGTDSTGGTTGGSSGDTGGFDDIKETDTCDAQDFEISRVPTRLMILQDMSGSMSSGEGAWGGGKTKWILAREALTSMLTNPANSAIEFGFDMFPDDPASDDSCTIGNPVIQDAAPGAASTIVSAIQSNGISPFGSTPLCASLVNFNTNVVPNYAPKFQADGAQQFLLVVSDGEDTCGGENGCGGVNGYSSATDLRDRTTDLLNLGVRTFVIGFGAALGTSSQLNSMAAAGGTGYTKAINVKDQTELQTALDSIAATVASCTFEIDEPDESADPNEVNFMIDGDDLRRDDTCTQDGWRWVDTEHTQVEFCGATCDSIKSGTVSQIQATFGCPTLVL